MWAVVDHTETGPRFKFSSERLEKPGFKLTTPGLQGTEASKSVSNREGGFFWMIMFLKKRERSSRGQVAWERSHPVPFSRLFDLMLYVQVNSCGHVETSSQVLWDFYPALR